MPFFSSSSSNPVVAPKRVADTLSSEHFSSDPSALRHPVTLDFSGPTFKLRSIAFVKEVREGAPRDVILTSNELTSLAPLNRFSALRTLSAASNSLQVGAGLVLRLPRLQELDLSGNKLVAVPPLDGLPQLQVLHLQRNQIASNWEELQVCASTLREVDVSHNRLSWAQQHGEFESAMAALSKLQRLRELRLVGNPVAETPGMRFFLITAAPKLERLDGWDVSESERRGKLKGAPAPPAVAVMVVGDDDGGGMGGGGEAARRPVAAAAVVRAERARSRGGDAPAEPAVGRRRRRSADAADGEAAQPRRRRR